MRPARMPATSGRGGEDRPLLEDRTRTVHANYEDADEDKYGGKHSSAAFKRWRQQQARGGGRARSMALGAASVIKSWPDHLTVCWLTALGACFVIIVFVLALESRMSPSAYEKFTTMGLQRSCARRHERDADEPPATDTNVFVHVILNEDESFFPKSFEAMLEGVEHRHPHHTINLIVLRNDTLELSYKRNTRFKDWEIYNNQLDRPYFFDTSSAERDVTVGRRNRWSHDDVGHLPRVNLVRSTFSQYFQHSPLRYRWRIIPPELIPFVLRVLTLWENGGITMPWPMFKDKTDLYSAKASESKRLKALVESLKNERAYEGLGVGMNATELLVADLNRYVDLDDVTIEKPDKIAPLLAVEKKAAFDLLKKNNERERSEQDDDDDDEDSKESSGSSSSSLSLSDSEVHHRHRHHHSKKKNDTRIKHKKNNTEEIDKLLNTSKAQKRLAELKAKKAHLKEAKNENVDQIPKPLDANIPHKRVKRELQNPDGGVLPLDEIPADSNVPHKRVKRALHDAEDSLLALNKIPKEPSYFPNFNEFDSEEYFDPDEFALELSDTLQHESSEYESGYDSDYSYSGYNAVFQANQGRRWKRNMGVYIPGSSSSSEFRREPELLPAAITPESLQDLKQLLGSTSSSSSDESKGRNYFREENSYIKRRVHEDVNVFSIPNRLNLVMDRFGYYFSTKKPCHAFLGEVISALQSSYNLKDVETVVQNGLSSFCKGRKYNNCVGITLL